MLHYKQRKLWARLLTTYFEDMEGLLNDTTCLTNKT